MLRRRRATERGAAVVDFVLILLVLLPLVIGILQLALVLHVRNTLASAAAEGARHAAVVGSSPEAGEAKIWEFIGDTVSEKFVRTVDVRADTIDGALGYESVVEVDIPILGLGGPGVPVRVTGHAIAEQQNAELQNAEQP
jgi:hypothetical protein